jgi:hypothetical protein
MWMEPLAYFSRVCSRKTGKQDERGMYPSFQKVFNQCGHPAGVELDIKNEKSLPLWEASWDDEDRGDFSEDLKAELAKVA